MRHTITAFSRRHTRISLSRSLGTRLPDCCGRTSTTPIAPSEVPCRGIWPSLEALLFLLVAAASSSCSSSPTSPSSQTTSSQTKVYIQPGVPMTLSRISQTAQLSASAV